MPEQPGLKLGQALGISARGDDLIDKAQSAYTEYVPDDVKRQLETLKKVLELGGLTDPSSAFDGSAQGLANIGQLIADPNISPRVKQILQKVWDTMPKRRKLVRSSEMVTDAWSPQSKLQWGQHQTGSYSPVFDSAKIAVNRPGGAPRSLAGIIQTIGHELFGHGKEAQILRKKVGEEGLFQAVDKDQELDYLYREMERRADRAGDAFAKWASKQEFLPKALRDALAEEARIGRANAVAKRQLQKRELEIAKDYPELETEEHLKLIGAK